MGSFRVSPPTPERRLKHSTEGRLGMEEDQAQEENIVTSVTKWAKGQAGLGKAQKEIPI